LTLALSAVARYEEGMRTRLLLALASVVGVAALSTACKKDQPADPVATSGRVVQITADGEGFKPSSVTIPKDTATKLVFTRTTDDTCATEVVFPDLDVKKDLPKGTPVTVDVPTDQARTLTFQCGMGKSSVVIASN
jgi:plastocyanin domain-containing protein